MKFEKYKTKRLGQKKSLLIKPLLLWLLLGIFVISTVFVAIQGATTGAKLAALENEERDLLSQKESLSMQLVNLTSLTKIQELAQDYEFTVPKTTLYIKASSFVAKLP